MQIPTEVPKPDSNTPINLSNIWEVIVYIVIPLVLIVVYFWLRKKRWPTPEPNEAQDE
ncbi:MAG: adenylosuccinate synthetase [Flavobacteriaceae bacterium]